MTAPAQTGIQGPDYVMLVGYFALMLAIGAYFYRYMRGMKMYFTGGNKIPWWLSGVSFYMSSFSAYAFVIYSGLCFRFGWVGVTLFWVTVPATIFSVTFFATRWRRARIDSPTEFLESRYSAWVRQLFVWTGVPVGIIDDSLKLIATGTIVQVGMGVGLKESIVACGLIMVAYTFMGGLWAVTVTDFVQFVILAVAVLAVFPLSIAKAGGIEKVFEKSPPVFVQPLDQDFNWVYIVLLVGLYAVAYSSTHWHLIQKYFCVATEKDAKKVGWLVVLLNVIGPPLIFTPAIAARQFLPETMIDKEVYPRLCAVLLPVGMLGLIIAAMFSATMANLSSHFNVRASVLTNDVYRRLLRRHASERELVWAGRGMTLLVGALAIVVALTLADASAPKLFKYMVTLFGAAVGPLGIPMLLGITTKRISALSASAGLVGGIVVSALLVFNDRLMPGGGDLWGVHWEKETMIFLLSSSTTLVLMYGVSLLWPMSSEEAARADTFALREATPIGELPEDRAAEQQHEGVVFSPFRVVGISVLSIGLMMLAVQPWISDRLATVLNVLLGTTLLFLGALMTWLSGRAGTQQSLK